MDTIRIIHNLPRSGGTIISKSVGVQEDIILLSEIHPMGPYVREKMGVDPNFGQPIFQTQSSYKLFDKNDLNQIRGKTLSFIEKVKFISKKVKDKNKNLVIRDWSFVDFLGEPYIKPTKKNTLLEILSNHFEIKNIYVIRDPLQNYLSCCNRLTFFLTYYSFDLFLDGYNSYLKNISKDNFIIFEKFIKEPEKSLMQISSILNFNFDKKNLVKLDNLDKLNITGDITANSSKVIKNVKKWDNILSSEEKEKVNNNLKYKDIKEKLNELLKKNL